MLRQVALVSSIDSPDLSELTQVAPALQKQATRDFGPIWNVDATVDAFASFDDVPVGYWPIILTEDVEGGVHEDKDGQPFALVQFVPQAWSLAASHECMEMLCDPSGSRLMAGQSPKNGQGRVEFLVEICDPCEAPQVAYTVNGVTVSDFYTPHYFDPVASSSLQYSFTGAITTDQRQLNLRAVLPQARMLLPR
jgi:hypothetical protein